VSHAAFAITAVEAGIFNSKFYDKHCAFVADRRVSFNHPVKYRN
jgi:hypothetical protein